MGPFHIRRNFPIDDSLNNKRFHERKFILDKPENPFQNYELAKKILEEEKKFLCLKNTLIQPLEVQKPETGQKTGPRTTRKILCANEPV